MHCIVRSYAGAGAKELFDLIVERKDEVERVLRSDVPGLVSYALVPTQQGGFTVTTCKDKAGCDASAKVAAGWIKANAAHIGTSPPAISEGPVALHLV